MKSTSRRFKRIHERRLARQSAELLRANAQPTRYEWALPGMRVRVKVAASMWRASGSCATIVENLIGTDMEGYVIVKWDEPSPVADDDVWLEYLEPI